MKTKKIQQFGWVILALTLTFASSAQTNNYRNRINTASDVKLCLEQISDLTDKQKTDLLMLEEQHQKIMTELRNTRRSTFDLDEKNRIYDQMQYNKNTHQKAVKTLLTAEQQKQYDLIQAGGGLHKFQTNTYRAGNGRGNNGIRQGKGNRNIRRNASGTYGTGQIR